MSMTHSYIQEFMFLWVCSQCSPTAKQSTLPNRTYREQNETGCRTLRLFLSWQSVLNMHLLTSAQLLYHFTAKLLQLFFCRTNSICPLSPQAQYVATQQEVLTSGYFLFMPLLGSWHLLPVFAGIQFTLILPHILYQPEQSFIAQRLDMYINIWMGYISRGRIWW